MNKISIKKPGKIEDKRFSEIDTMWPWISLWLKVKKILYKQKSKFQDILVFESESFWNVLVLDWVIQVTERDESAYQEMLAHLPLFVHKKPERVLIIGWWDGWILREVVKHNSVKKAILCEIDEWVINVSKEFLPGIAVWFKSDKADIIVWDWAKYIKESKKKFDIVIVDSSDPIWPANTLFTENFYKSVKEKLNKWWVIAIQWESLFLHKDIATNLKKLMGKLFKFVDYAQVHVPTYPWGNIWLLVCSDQNDVRKPTREIPKELKKSLKYYSSEIHKASFVLPPYYKV